MRKYVFFLVLTTVMLVTLAACGRNTADNIQTGEPAEPIEIVLNDNGIFYQFDALGFSFLLPTSWEGKYGIEELGGIDLVTHEDGFMGLAIYHMATREEMESDFAGWLFSFMKTPIAYFEDEMPSKGDYLPPQEIVLAVSEEYVYTLPRPTDVQWNYEASESTSALEFQEMAKQIDFVIDNFRLIEPVAQTHALSFLYTFYEFPDLGFLFRLSSSWYGPYGISQTVCIKKRMPLREEHPFLLSQKILILMTEPEAKRYTVVCLFHKLPAA